MDKTIILNMKIKNKRKKEKEKIDIYQKINSILVVAFFSMRLIDILWLHEYTVILLYFGFFIAVFAFLNVSIHQSVRLKKDDFLLFGTAWIGLFIGILYNNNLEWTELIWCIKYFCIAYVLLQGELWEKPVIITYMGFVLFFFLSFYKGQSIFTLAESVSRNAIGMNLLLLVSIYYISITRKEGHRFSFMVPLSFLLITFWTGSRSSIITAFILLFGEIFSRKKEQSRKIFLKLAIILMLFVLSVMWLNKSGRLDSYLGAFALKSNLVLIQDTRFELIAVYFDSCVKKMGNLFWGADLNSIPRIAYFSGNPHNMFIRLHANFGLVFFLLITIKSIKTSVYLLKNNQMLFFVFVAMLARGFADIVGFTGLFDPIIYFFLLIESHTFLRISKTDRKNTNKEKIK